MNESRHTPSPWSASVGTRGASIHIANIASHPLSFHLEYPEPHIDEDLNEQGMANAHLIAAAPELLEVAIELIDRIDNDMLKHGDFPDVLSAIARMNQAIANARGE